MIAKVSSSTETEKWNMKLKKYTIKHNKTQRK